MGSTISIGKVLGIPVNLHVSWFIVFILFTFMFQRHFDRPEYDWDAGVRWLAAVATSLILFLSVLFHELSHSLMAARWGLPVKGITLFLFGGVSQIGKEASRPWVDFVVAAVGPFSSIVLGFIALGLAFGLEGVSEHLSAIAWLAVYVNIMLGIFNMLPGFPMDGGRVLRAAAWGITGDYWKSTLVASLVGRAMAALLIAGGVAVFVLAAADLMDGLWTQGLWMVVLGAFLYAVASATHRQTRMRGNLRLVTAGEVMTASCPVAPGEVTLRQLMDEYMAPSGQNLALVSMGGQVHGVVTREELMRVPRNRWPQQPAGSLMVPLSMMQAVRPGEGAFAVLELMDGSGVNHVLVVEEGVLMGVISRESFRAHASARNRDKRANV